MSWGSTIIHGRITHVIDPSNFWIAMGTASDFKNYEMYTSELNTFYNINGDNFQVQSDCLTNGSEVMVFSKTIWNRARIMRRNENTVDVFYIDLGYTEIVDLKQVRHITYETFQYLPPKVRRMGLAGIKPLSKSWTSKATSYFTDLVLNRDLLVFIVEMDDSQSCGWILIFIESMEGTWTSVTEKMLEDEMGESSGQRFAKALSKELVHSIQEMENICPSEPQQVFHFPQQDSNERTEITPCDKNNSTVNKIVIDVPTQDLQSLEQTKTLTVSDIKNGKSKKKVSCHEAPEKKERETDIFDWGKTDLYVGVPDVFSDVHDISKQIAQTFQSDSVGSEVDIFPYRKPKDVKAGQATSETEPPTLETKPPTLETEPSILEVEPPTSETGPQTIETEPVIFKTELRTFETEPVIFETDTHEPIEDDEEFQPLSEEASYRIGKDIMLILENETTDEEVIVCQLVNDVIEPDVNVTRDLLNVVIETLLEALVNNRVETERVLTVLDTYLGAELFKEVLVATLKVLKNKYIKLPQSVRLRGRHLDFVKVLTIVFNHSVNWPKRLSKPVQEHTVNWLKLWIVFNKTGQQSYESSLSVELMYLNCVKSFLLNSGQLLLQLYPEHYCNIIEEMKGKLLNDLTHESVKSMLLDLILKHHVSCPKRDIGTQTGEETEETSDINERESDTLEMYMTSSQDLLIQVPGNKMNLNPGAPEFELPKLYPPVSLDTCSQDLVLSHTEDRNTGNTDCSKSLVQDTPRLKYTVAQLKELNPLKSSHAQNIIYTQPEEMLYLISRKDERKMFNEVNKREEAEPVLDMKQDSCWRVSNDIHKQEEAEKSFPKAIDSLSRKPVLDMNQGSNQIHKQEEAEKSFPKAIDSLSRKPVLDMNQGSNQIHKQEAESSKKIDSPCRKPVLDMTQESNRKRISLINSHLNDGKFSNQTNKKNVENCSKPLNIKQDSSCKMLTDTTDKEKAKLLSKKAESHSWSEHNSDSSQGATSPEQEACIRESTVFGKPTLGRIAEDFMSIPNETKRLSSSSGDWNSFESSQETEDHRKGPMKTSQKKKKTKYQPLRQFLTAQVSDKEDETATRDAEDDLLSPESIAWYEKLENEKTLMDGGELIHASTLGAGSVNNRQSRFPQWEKPLSSSRPHGLWCPEQWRCTRCNSKEHNVYDCPEQDGYDSQYMLI